jgi:hypothetical protein
MELDRHRRARILMDESRITEIAPQDALWLRRHVADCAECARYEAELEALLRGLQSFAFDLDPTWRDRVQGALATCARSPRVRRWWALPAAALLLAAVAPLYHGARDARREEADTLLMERVESRVRRIVPIAMEPLIQSSPEEPR